MATKMSAEEKAVRDALAVVNADTGIAQAQAAIAGVSTPAPVTSTSTTSTPNVAYDPLTGKVISGQTSISDYVNKSTTSTKTPEQLATEAAAADAAAKLGKKDTSLTDRTLASDTFMNTFALVFGKAEASQPYVKQLYSIVSGFYKSGSSIDESLNLAIRQARQDKSIPEFTKRFTGLFALEDKFNAGMAVEVPTIAQFFAAESKMGDILNQAGLGDLATQEFLGNVIGQGKSALTVANLISDVFNTIDTAPAALKADLNTYFPSVDRTSLAKALLTGTAGAQELSNKIKGISVLSAAGTQGVSGVGLDYAQNLANMGIDYQQALTGFGQVKNLERANNLAQLSGGQFTTAQAEKAVFEKNIEEQNKLEQIKLQEQGRFQGSAGTSRGSFSTQYLNKSSSSGQY